MVRPPTMDAGIVSQGAPGVLLGLGAIVLCLGLRAGGWLEELELSLHDHFLRRHAGAEVEPSPVVPVAIREADFDRFGYPIPDRVLAQALEQLSSAGASAVGIDLFREGPASPSPEDLAGWSAFERAVAASPRVIATELIASAADRGMSAPDFARPEQVGFNNLLLDSGRIVRRGYLFGWDEAGQAHTAFGLRLALLHLAGERIGLGPAPDQPEWIRLGETVIPPLEPDFGAYVGLDAGGYQFALDYARAPDAFETVSFADLVDGRVGSQRLAGRVAILGTDAPSVKDDFNAPYADGEPVKGFLIHAHVADQLIRLGRGESSLLGDWSARVESGWIVAWGVVAIGVCAALGSLAWAAPVLVAGLALLYAASAWLFANEIWVPTVAPALVWVSAGGIAIADRARREAREQRQLMALFRRFSSRRVADALWRQRDEFMEGGRPRPQRLMLTALLSDLKGYTAASEKMEPHDLMAWIDSYMDAMTRVIEKHEGHVDDYVGDGIKANFGVPVPRATEAEIAEDARSAVRCAIEMGRTLERLNAEWRRKGWPTGRQRIGLYTGPAVVGAIGSDERTKYTSVGDTINTAARLEAIGGNLDFDRETALQRILVGEPTRRALGDRFELSDEGTHRVKGKSEPLRIYRVHGERPLDAEEEER